MTRWEYCALTKDRLTDGFSVRFYATSHAGHEVAAEPEETKVSRPT